MPQRRPPIEDSFEHKISAFFIQPDGTRVPFSAVLRFDKADPFAVTLRLRTTDIRTITWTFARQLLVDGTRRPTGIGAVEVRPAFYNGNRILVLHLRSSSGQAEIHLPHDQVTAFLNSTYAAVPSGTESDLVDWNAELAQLRDGDL